MLKAGLLKLITPISGRLSTTQYLRLTGKIEELSFSDLSKY